MSNRHELEDKYTVRCKDCGTEWINPEKKPNQKYGRCRTCMVNQPVGLMVTATELTTLIEGVKALEAGLTHKVLNGNPETVPLLKQYEYLKGLRTSLKKAQRK